MIELIPKIPLYKSFKLFSFPKLMPKSMTFVSTYRCNSKCKTCEIWRIKNYEDELKLWEYKKIFQSIGKLSWATIGGGEPFLREDFIAIVKELCKNCRPEIVNIPTNGSLYEIIPRAIKEILKNSNGAKIILNVSLDGIGKRHDETRGFPDNFELTMKTIKELKKINGNFILGINSILSKFNINNFDELYNFVDENIKPDSFIMEVAQNRREFFNLNSKLLPQKEKIIKVLEFVLNRYRQKRPPPNLKIIKRLRLAYYNYLLSLLDKKEPIQCYAGYVSCQVNAYGDVWVCATKGLKLGNLRENNYDFKKIWFSKEAEEARNKIDKECACTLANVFYTNLLFNLRKWHMLI